jgi:competence protein ComEC
MLKIHFLNVGHGDCCIVEFMDNTRVAIIDINRTLEMDENSAREIYESLSHSLASQLILASNSRVSYRMLEQAGYDIQLQDPIEYLREHNISSVFRFISTHPHMDHLSGLYELNTQFCFGNAWIIKNSYKQDMDKLTESQKNDWGLYKKYRDTGEKEVDGTTIIRPEEGSQAQYYKEDGIKILAPNDSLKDGSDSNANKLSYVLLIKHKGRKILLPGDAEKETGQYVLDNYSADLEGIDILKAAHHGRDSGYYQPAVKHMSPMVTVVSVGKKPDTDASNKYKQYYDHVWSTRWKGNIVFTIDNAGEITYTAQFDG